MPKAKRAFCPTLHRLFVLLFRFLTIDCFQTCFLHCQQLAHIIKINLYLIFNKPFTLDHRVANLKIIFATFYTKKFLLHKSYTIAILFMKYKVNISQNFINLLLHLHKIIS